MIDINVGELIAQDAQRDAIHIAVAPVTVLESIKPGAHVGLVEGDTDTVTAKADVKIGIIDPYLTSKVLAGQRCWLFLYTKTVTSLRHEWTHPAFSVVPQSSAVEESRAWIEAWAAELDQTYSRLMEAAAKWIDEYDYTYDNSEKYKNVDYDKWPEFWRHFAVVTGRDVNDTIRNRGENFFTCSC